MLVSHLWLLIVSEVAAAVASRWSRRNLICHRPWRRWWGQQRVVIRSRPCDGLPKACGDWRQNCRSRGFRLADKKSPICCMTWVIACKPTARCEKEVNTLIATPNLNTSPQKLRPSSLETSPPFRCTPKRKSWSVTSKTTGGSGVPKETRSRCAFTTLPIKNWGKRSLRHLRSDGQPCLG